VVIDVENKTTAVLLIEDNADDAWLLRSALKRGRGQEFQLEHAEVLATGLDRLNQGGIDVVILDLSLPDSTGPDTFRRVHSQASDIPIMVLTGLDDETLGESLVREGAQDYLTKGQLDNNVLVRSIRYAIERKRTEQALRALDVMKSEFIDNVSHELRTPLHSIMGFSGLLMDGKVPDHETQQRFLERIFKLSQKLASLIDHLLDASRISSGDFTVQPDPMNPSEAVTDVVGELDGLASMKGVAIEQQCIAELPQVLADEDRLKQVLTNLLSNAIKFTEAGGVIKIDAYATDRNLLIQVSDNGIGISPEELPHVFERFFRASQPEKNGAAGTGIGLYISKQIINAHGGEIWAESAVGKGSVFNISLPLASKMNIDNQ
jgi:signal transduction histidine kinase